MASNKEDKGMFDFLKGEEEVEETATSGNPKDPAILHQGLTKEQILEAQRMAESPQGLDMDTFIKQAKVVNIDFDQLLSFKVD